MTAPARTYWDADRDEVLICREIRDETHDVRTFVLSALEPRLFDYRPGQFMTFEIPVGGVTHSRCYTLASSPARPNLVSITVKRVPGGPVSNWLHDHFQVGGRLNALGPMGEFVCDAQGERDLLFLSAGSGVTPLMSMARAHHDLCDRRDVVFVHSARSPVDVIFKEEVALMARAAPSFRAATICEDAGTGWNGFTGRLSLPMLSLIAPDFLQRDVYVCGPTGFMDAARTMLADAGFDMARYHQESFVFEALSPADQQQADGAAPSADRIFKVEFTQSRRTIDAPEDAFVLAAAKRAGMRLPSSCTQGVCGTCKSRLVSGEVKMTHAGGIRQREIDQGMILLCCSRPVTDLVIER